MIRPNSPTAQLSDADLADTWAWIATQRVKSGPSKGCVKLAAAKLGDRILAEAKARGCMGLLA